jgi:MFS family permease
VTAQLSVASFAEVRPCSGRFIQDLEGCDVWRRSEYVRHRRHELLHVASAAGCIAGGHLSDIWKQYDARGRLFVCMLSVVLVTPIFVAMLNASEARVIYMINPLLALALQMSTGSAAAAIQDCVLPRMRGTAGAIFLLAISMLGLALGPYATGKVAALTDSLRVC